MLAGPPQAKRVLPTSQPAHELAMGRYAMARDARHKLPRRTKDDNASRIRAWRQAPSSGSAVSLIQQASVLASLTLTWRSGIAPEYLSIRTNRTASSGSFESAWCNYAKGVLLRSCTLLRTSFPARAAKHRSSLTHEHIRNRPGGEPDESGAERRAEVQPRSGGRQLVIMKKPQSWGHHTRRWDRLHRAETCRH